MVEAWRWRRKEATPKEKAQGQGRIREASRTVEGGEEGSLRREREARRQSDAGIELNSGQGGQVKGRPWQWWTGKERARTLGFVAVRRRLQSTEGLSEKW